MATIHFTDVERDRCILAEVVCCQLLFQVSFRLAYLCFTADENASWVPLDEYYYGKKEGDPSYREEKKQFRFKVSTHAPQGSPHSVKFKMFKLCVSISGFATYMTYSIYYM